MKLIRPNLKASVLSYHCQKAFFVLVLLSLARKHKLLLRPLILSDYNHSVISATNQGLLWSFVVEIAA